MSFPAGATVIPNELPEPFKRVAPWVLAHADSLCSRRLHAEFTSQPRTRDPFTRGRIREAVIDAIRTLHETGKLPGLAPHLEVEEQRVVEHALGWYPRLFDVTGCEIQAPKGLDAPTEFRSRDVHVGGFVDLCVVGSGGRELRQLAFGARDLPESPLDLPAVRLAVLRLAYVRWVSDEPLSVVWADLLTGARREASLNVPSDLAAPAHWLDEQLGILRARMDPDLAEAGRDCATCGFIPRCPAHDLRAGMLGKMDRFPEVIALSPTLLDSWHRCRRDVGNRALSIPPSDPEGGTSHGLYMHDVLRFLHQRAEREGTSCRDQNLVAEILRAHGGDERVAAEIRRHAEKCPTGAESLGHEVEWVRTNPHPPVFLASARLDDVWRQGDVLEVRDYKTGTRAVEVISDDVRARVQAWVAAPRAAKLGLRLRVRYEHLAREIDEDPDPWEPDEEDLAQIDDELRLVVAEMRAERDWRGVKDEAICCRCRYRSICPDSATPGEPIWPAVA